MIYISYFIVLCFDVDSKQEVLSLIEALSFPRQGENLLPPSLAMFWSSSCRSFSIPDLSLQLPGRLLPRSHRPRRNDVPSILNPGLQMPSQSIFPRFGFVASSALGRYGATLSSPSAGELRSFRTWPPFDRSKIYTTGCAQSKWEKRSEQMSQSPSELASIFVKNLKGWRLCLLS
jgi:hypothetical protein